jgi:lysophospholipase L1-like esterase
MRTWLVFSLLLNLAFAAALFLFLHRLGGWRYALYRFQHTDAGLYAHRRELFDLLPVRPGAIIFLGDSQVQGCEWRELCGDSLPLLNRGIAGDHVDGVAGRLGEVLRHRPSQIFLQVGVNDLLFVKEPEEIAAGYRQLLERIRRESPESRVVLHGVLPVNNEVRRIGLNNASVRALNVRLREMCREMDLPFVDLHPLLADAGGNLDARYTDDGIHLNGQGYLRWKKALEPWTGN